MKYINKYIFEKLKINKNSKPNDIVISDTKENIYQIIRSDVLGDRNKYGAISALVKEWVYNNDVTEIKIYLDKKDDIFNEHFKPNMEYWEYVNDDINNLCDEKNIKSDSEFKEDGWSASFTCYWKPSAIALYYKPAKKYIYIMKNEKAK